MTSIQRALAVLACALATAVPAQAAQSPLGEGAWSWFGDPRAVTASGKTFVGWVDHEGDIKVSSYDHASGERVTAVLQARLNKDDHANPSLHVRPDGRLMVFYSRHVGPAMAAPAVTASSAVLSPASAAGPAPIASSVAPSVDFVGRRPRPGTSRRAAARRRPP